MKMILSSCDFINDNSKNTILSNIDKDLDKCKVLFIPNEKATREKIFLISTTIDYMMMVL